MMDTKTIAQLLDFHSRELPPDYYGFYKNTENILSSGTSPRAFCEEYAIQVKIYNDLMQQYSDRGKKGEELGEADLKQFGATFNKYKLLMGCAEKLPREMRELISSLAGCRMMGM